MQKKLQPNFKKSTQRLPRSSKKPFFCCWRHSFVAIQEITQEEIPFFIDIYAVNPALNPNAVVLGQKPENKKNNIKPSYVLVKVGVLGKNPKQIHNFYPVKELTSTEGALDLHIGSCRLTESELSGSVSVSAADAVFYPECMSDSGDMSWDIRFEAKKGYIMPPFYFALERFFNLNTYRYVLGIQSEYSGKITLDGRNYKIVPEKSFGYSDYMRGGAFDNRYFRLSCNAIYSQFLSKKLTDSFLLIDSCNIRKKNNNSLVFLVAFYYEGELFEFGYLHSLGKNAVTFNFIEENGLLHWSLSAKNKSYVLDVKVMCKKNEALPLNLESPNGIKTQNVLLGATGYGEVKLYKKNGKILEALEHLTVTNTRFEFAS